MQVFGSTAFLNNGVVDSEYILVEHLIMAKDNSQNSSSSAPGHHHDAVGEDRVGNQVNDAHNDTNDDANDADSSTGQRGSLIKRLGFYGFMFFLIKGLLWLIIPALMVYFGYDWGAD